MSRGKPIVYDTRFFVEHFYSNDETVLSRTKQELEITESELVVSVITLHELYLVNLDKQGRDVALLRTTMIGDVFRTVEVDLEIARQGAELRKKYSVPMGDSLIAATAQILRATCVTDDPHFSKIKEIKTRWI